MLGPLPRAPTPEAKGEEGGDNNTVSDEGEPYALLLLEPLFLAMLVSPSVVHYKERVLRWVTVVDVVVA